MGPERLVYPKSRRLRKRREFVRVQDGNVRVTTPHFILLLAPGMPASPCRLGIVASKKVGPAVARNRAKRLLREAFRTMVGLFPEGIDLVVIAKPGAADLAFSEVCRELEDVSGVLARRAGKVLQKGGLAPLRPPAAGHSLPPVTVAKRR